MSLESSIPNDAPTTTGLFTAVFTPDLSKLTFELWHVTLKGNVDVCVYGSTYIPTLFQFNLENEILSNSG